MKEQPLISELLDLIAEYAYEAEHYDELGELNEIDALKRRADAFAIIEQNLRELRSRLADFQRDLGRL